MKSKLPLISSILIITAIALAGCSSKSSSNNANSNTSNANTTTMTVENSNLEETEETADDSSTSPSDTGNRSTGKTAREDKSANNNKTPSAKRSPEKEPTIKNTEKQIRKQSDRALKDAGGVIKEGERRVRDILNGRP